MAAKVMLTFALVSGMFAAYAITVFVYEKCMVDYFESRKANR